MNRLCHDREAIGPVKPRVVRRPRLAVACVLAATLQVTAGVAQEAPVRLTQIARVGVVDGDARYQFFEIAAALSVRGDTIVVADGGSQNLRFYDPSGQFVRSVGGAGDGPGEYRRLTSVTVWRDSLFVYDHDLARMTVLDRHGGMRRSFRLGFDDSRPLQSILGVVEPGLVIGEVGAVLMPGVESGIRRDSFTVAAYDLAGRHVRPIGRFNGNDQIVLVRTTAGSMSASKRLLPNGRMTFRATSSTRIVVGETDRYEVKQYDADGKLVSQIQQARDEVQLSPEEQAGMRRRITAAPDPNQRREAERLIRGMELPRTRPAYSDLAVATDGRILIRESAAGQDGARWTLFDTVGQLRSHIVLPVTARILHLREGTLITVESDDVGVEQVVMYHLGQ